MAGRRSIMDDPEERQNFAELYARGMSRTDLAEHFGVSNSTITDWSKRKDIQALVTEINRGRANRIVRKLDSIIEERINDPNELRNMTVKDLMAIRKELVPQRMEIGRAGEFNEDQAELEAWAALDAGEETRALPVPEAEVIDDE